MRTYQIHAKNRMYLYDADSRTSAIKMFREDTGFKNSDITEVVRMSMVVGLPKRQEHE